MGTDTHRHSFPHGHRYRHSFLHGHRYRHSFLHGHRYSQAQLPTWPQILTGTASCMATDTHRHSFLHGHRYRHSFLHGHRYSQSQLPTWPQILTVTASYMATDTHVFRKTLYSKECLASSSVDIQHRMDLINDPRRRKRVYFSTNDNTHSTNDNTHSTNATVKVKDKWRSVYFSTNAVLCFLS